MTAADPFRSLGVRHSARGGEIAIWSESASSVAVTLYGAEVPYAPIATLDLTRDADFVWRGSSPLLKPGRQYTLSVDGPIGPTHQFDPARPLIDPWGRGVLAAADGSWRSVVVDNAFDWGTSQKPQTPLDATVIYEAHVKGLTRLAPDVPEELRGTYAGLAHESTISYLKDLGVTAVELLPIHQFVTEARLRGNGMVNYWGYNTLNFFTPHAAYATAAAQAAGPDAVIREFKGMVRLLHEAGLEVILDVVYNHTAEEGLVGPTTSLRGIDNANYYRQTAAGQYIDVTGCGNTVNFSTPAAQRLVMDSLRYWVREFHIDGFRFDLATALGRNKDVEFDKSHPLINNIISDSVLTGTKMIAEPWDVGMGGWQTGNFPEGWSEWNDRYRDRMRDFWLRDIAAARMSGSSGSGIGRFATRFAGSSLTFAAARGPLASVNFITAHDGFTLHDLVSYNVKHNLLNGEHNRDGTSNNLSFNHGFEGPSKDEDILRVRRKAIRNLLGTLLLSAGVPMLTAGDEYGRTQRGNNNAYCQDNELTWLDWSREPWQLELQATTRRLLQLRAENPALRPVRYGVFGETTPSATQMDWFDGGGEAMDEADWNSPESRTLQYLAASTPEFEDFNRILLIVNATEDDTIVWLPVHEGVESYTLLWNSAHDNPETTASEHRPGAVVGVSGTSMQLFRAH